MNQRGCKNKLNLLHSNDRLIKLRYICDIWYDIKSNNMYIKLRYISSKNFKIY